MLYKNIYNEFIKILNKPRSYIGIGVLTVLILTIEFALKLDGNSILSFVTSSFEQTLNFSGKILNGNLVAFIIIQMLIVHVPLLIALVTGDLVSGEAAMGTIRMLVTKPISRANIILSKFIAGGAYTLLITLWMGLLSFYFSGWLFGKGDVIVLNSDGLVILKEVDVAWRFLSAFCVSFLSLLTISSLSICLSVFSDNSIGPIVSTMAIIILFTIIGSIDISAFNLLKPYLFTTHMASWRSFFNQPIITNDIIQSILVLIIHNILFFAIAVLKFNHKDIKS